MIIEMNKKADKTITGSEECGLWVFRGENAERVAEICGTKLVQGYGHTVTGFAAKDECLYTARIVKAGYKICIN